MSQPIYGFGPYQLDASRRRLQRDGEVVQLTPKAFDILLALIEGRGEIIGKDDLMKRVWPDSFVEDGNLTYNISVLRKALGERTGENQYIVTVPGRGYQFVANVSAVPFDTAVPALQAQHEFAGAIDTKVAEKGTLVLDHVSADAARLRNNHATEISPAGVMRHKIVLGAIALTVVALISIGGYLRFGRSVQKTLINTVAVIPFANGSDNSEMEFLSDGISESLINSLSQQPDIKVIARSSSFKYKGLEVDPLEVARTLDVEAILTGRVALLGDNLVISTELTDARDNTQIWGQQYRRKATDLLLTQAEIAREIAQKLRLTLTAPQQQQLTKLETANPQAYEMLLRGRFYREKGGTEDLKRAVGFYKRAIAMDPAYARAYVELSSLYTFIYVERQRSGSEGISAASGGGGSQGPGVG